jgi:hypothetical protein
VLGVSDLAERLGIGLTRAYALVRDKKTPLPVADAPSLCWTVQQIEEWEENESVWTPGWDEGGTVWTAPNQSKWGVIGLLDRQRRQRSGETRFPESAMWGMRLLEFGDEVASYSTYAKRSRVRKLLVPGTLKFDPPCFVYNLADAQSVNEFCVKRDGTRRETDSARVEKLHKQHAIKTDADGDWYALRKAARYLAKRNSLGGYDQVRTKLQRWKVHCPFLDRGIDMRRFESWNAREEDYFKKTDLDEIINVATRLHADGKGPKNGRVSAVNRVGVSEKTLNKLLPEGAKSQINGKRTDGRPCKVTIIDEEQLSKLVEYRSHPTITQAAKDLGVDARALRALIRRGLIKVLDDPYGYERYQRIHKDIIAELKKQRTEEDISIDEEGTWLPMNVALKRYPNATAKTLYKYANKPCPQLRGDILHAKQAPPNPLLRGRGKRKGQSCLKWLEADLQRMEKGKVGKPGQNAARVARERAATQQTANSQPAATPDLHEGIVALKAGQQQIIEGQEQIKETGKEILQEARRRIAPEDIPAAPPAEAEAEQYVTLDQMAALVNRSKKTLERKANATTSDMPAPDVEGGGGKPHEWKWTTIRPWLEKHFNRKLPERFPR